MSVIEDVRLHVVCVPRVIFVAGAGFVLSLYITFRRYCH